MKDPKESDPSMGTRSQSQADFLRDVLSVRPDVRVLIGRFLKATILLAITADRTVGFVVDPFWYYLHANALSASLIASAFLLSAIVELCVTFAVRSWAHIDHLWYCELQLMMSERCYSAWYWSLASAHILIAIAHVSLLIATRCLPGRHHRRGAGLPQTISLLQSVPTVSVPTLDEEGEEQAESERQSSTLGGVGGTRAAL